MLGSLQQVTVASQRCLEDLPGISREHLGEGVPGKRDSLCRGSEDKV